MKLPPESIDEIVRLTSEKTGVSRATVRFVIEDFEKRLRKVLADPLEYGIKIIINKFVIFTFKTEKTRRKLDAGVRRYTGREKVYLRELLNKYCNEQKRSEGYSPDENHYGADGSELFPGGRETELLYGSKKQQSG